MFIAWPLIAIGPLTLVWALAIVLGGICVTEGNLLFLPLFRILRCSGRLEVLNSETSLPLAPVLEGSHLQRLIRLCEGLTPIGCPLLLD